MISVGIEDTLNKYEDYLRTSTEVSYRTITKYRSVVRRFLLTYGTKFDMKMVNDWLYNITKNKSCNYYRYAIRHFLISVGRKDLGERVHKSRKKPRQKVFNFVPKSTMTKVINSLEGFYQKLAFIQIKTGIRVTEAMTLRAENIDYNISPDFVQIKIGVNKSLTKRKKEKIVYVNKKYEGLLRRWVQKPYGYIFLPEKFEDLDEEDILPKLETIRRRYNEKLQKAGEWFHVSGLSSHYMRHLFSDYFLKAGGDPVYLKKALGHERLETTMGYVSIEDQMMKDVLQNMEAD